jgi:2-polyprenyl-3-methyl-5-hydroxy-6-metoxy-1,4-benzoquinol methylase
MSLINTETTYEFINPADQLSILINQKANELFHKLRSLKIEETELDEFSRYYYVNHHLGKRIYFSLESSARIIYDTVNKSGKDISDITFMDYGAGLGTLFALAGMVGFKQVYFNDLLQVWANDAATICKKLEIPITNFIIGDVNAVIEYGKKNDVHFDIIASRNVIEHIYHLREFYSKLRQSDLTAICYATTTANYQNPAMRLKHVLYHRKVENSLYKKQRREQVLQLVPGIMEKDLNQLVKITRGRAFGDFTDTVNLYLAKKEIPAVEFLGSNTCDCKTGVWAENIINKKNYRRIIEDAGFSFEYSAGFWDTNYKYSFANMITAIFNRVIQLWGKNGYWLSPFVNVVAYNKQQCQEKK